MSALEFIAEERRRLADLVETLDDDQHTGPGVDVLRSRSGPR